MTSERNHDAEISALGRYWDALAQGRPMQRDAIEPGLAAVIKTLHARDDAPGADPAFAARLRDDLMEVWRASHHLHHGGALPAMSPNGRAPASHVPPALPHPAPVRRFRHAGSLATAALVLLTLAASIAAIGITVRFRSEQASGPSFVADAVPAFTDPQADLGLLATATAASVPPIAGYTSIERWTYPARSDAVTTNPLSGPMLIFVTSGQLTVTLDGEEATLQGSGLGETGDPFGALLAASSGRVVAGQSLLLPARTRMTTSNSESIEATALVVAIITDSMDDWSLPFDQTAVKQESLVTARATFAPGPAEISLRRATIEAGASVPPPPVGTFQIVAAESKYLGYLGRHRDGSVTNLEKEPLTVLIVGVTQPADEPPP